jgi:hypothetical protein
LNQAIRPTSNAFACCHGLRMPTELTIEPLTQPRDESVGRRLGFGAAGAWLAARLLPRKRRQGATLRALANRLETLAAESEPPFLNLGASLEAVHRSARMLQSASADAAGRHEDTVAAAWLPRLTRLIGELEARLGRARATLGRIETTTGKVRSCLREARTPLLSMQVTISKLRVLAVLTRIESAHLTDDSRSIALVAEEVATQAGAIAGLAEKFLAQSDGLRLALHVANERAGLLQRQQNQAGELALQQISGVLAGMDHYKERAQAWLAQAAASARDIAEHMGRVVTSLQFHDITRQRIVHAAGALRDASTARRAAATAMTRLQAAQLQQAGQDLGGACERLLGSLEHIAEAAGVLTDGPMESDTAGAAAAEPLSRLQEQLAQAEPALKEIHRDATQFDRGVHELGQSLGQYRELRGSMTELAGRVSEITEQIKRIGINTAVKASKLGPRGAPLSILAQNVQSLAVDASEHSQAIRHLLEEMEQAAAGMGDLERSAPSRNGEEEGGHPDLDEFLSILAELRRTQHEQSQDRQQLRSQGRALVDGIMGTTRIFRIQNTFPLDIGKVCAELRRAGAGSNGAGDPADADVQALMAGLAASYTMSSERETHRVITAVPDRADGQSTEPAAGAVPAHGDAEGLGSNVELF